jgi:hypothetical protein
VYLLPIPEVARETRFLCFSLVSRSFCCSVSSRDRAVAVPPQTIMQALIELWDQGHHIALREELIRGSDFILMPPSWWSSTPCPRQHGWWVSTVHSITGRQRRHGSSGGANGASELLEAREEGVVATRYVHLRARVCVEEEGGSKGISQGNQVGQR